MASESGSRRWMVDLYDIPQTTRDSYGQPSQEATFLGRFPAEIKMLKGREAINIRQVRQIYAEATHEVKLGYLGVDVYIRPRMKFQVDTAFGTRILNIISADNTWEADMTWICICQEDIEAT